MSENRFCIHCGAKVEEGDAFCLECGQKLESEEPEGLEEEKPGGADAQEAAPKQDDAAEQVGDATPTPAAQDIDAQPAPAAQNAPAQAGSEQGAPQENAQPQQVQPGAAIDAQPAPAGQDAGAQPAPAAPGAAAAPAAPAPQSAAGGFKAWLSVPKNKKIFIGVVAVVVAAIVAFNVFSYLSSKVSSAAIEQAMKDRYGSGFVSANFTNGSDYKFSDTRLNKNEKIDRSSPAYSQLSSSVKSEIKSASQDLYYAEWYGKATNDSFETEYTAQGYFLKDGFGFRNIAGVSATWYDTKPLKGVEAFFLDRGKTSPAAGYCISTSIDNFECEFNAEQQTCTAKETYGVKYWWGEDSVDLSQNFKFDKEEGWQADGEVKTENLSTKYTELEGMSFASSKVRSYLFSSSSLQESASMTFKTCSPESVVVDYVLAYHPGSSDSGNTLDLTGQASGTLKHTLSQTGFEFDLSGSADGVKLRGYSWYDEDNLHTLTVSMESNAAVSKYAWSSKWSFSKQSLVQSSDSSVSGASSAAGQDSSSTSTSGNASDAGGGSYVIKDSATKTLGDSDISGLSDDQICIAQNEIWARHGRKFENKWLQDYFNGQSWYSGTIAAGDFLNKYSPTQTETDNANFLSAKLTEHGYDLNKAHPN